MKDVLMIPVDGSDNAIHAVGWLVSELSKWKEMPDETRITQRFTEHDFRAKAGSDAENLERAAQLLVHADPRLTDKLYRRKPQRIVPAR